MEWGQPIDPAALEQKLPRLLIFNMEQTILLGRLTLNLLIFLLVIDTY